MIHVYQKNFNLKTENKVYNLISKEISNYVSKINIHFMFSTNLFLELKSIKMNFDEQILYAKYLSIHNNILYYDKMNELYEIYNFRHRKWPQDYKNLRIKN